MSCRLAIYRASGRAGAPIPFVLLDMPLGVRLALDAVFHATRIADSLAALLEKKRLGTLTDLPRACRCVASVAVFYA